MTHSLASQPETAQARHHLTSGTLLAAAAAVALAQIGVSMPAVLNGMF